MSSSVPIGPDQFMLRRVPKSHVNLTLPAPILFPAFRPTSEDKKGLSFYLADKVTPEELTSAGRTPGEYFVARLCVRDVLALRLSVVAADLPGGLPGHVLIPEINCVEYQKNKKALHPLLTRLAVLANQDIVLRPEK